MIEKGLYYVDKSLIDIIHSVGGEWNDKKHRPVICLLKCRENSSIYWAVPMGKLNHRNTEQIERLHKYMDLPEKDLRSCYYHIGRTTSQSIFFISDAIPITEKYISEEHLGADKKHFIVKNPNLISELERKLQRILAFENSKPNYFRQHITDIKNYLINENTQI